MTTQFPEVSKMIYPALALWGLHVNKIRLELVNAGMIDNSKQGTYKITPKGNNMLTGKIARELLQFHLDAE